MNKKYELWFHNLDVEEEEQKDLFRALVGQESFVFGMTQRADGSYELTCPWTTPLALTAQELQDFIAYLKAHYGDAFDCI